MPKVPVGVDAKGLAVAPGFIDAHTHDDLASLMRGTGALYATRMRDESAGLLDSVSEAIEIGERAGVPVQISHHKASGERAWGLVKKSLALIEAAQAKGGNVHTDQYPFTVDNSLDNHQKYGKV